jgi:hypothetical protein
MLMLASSTQSSEAAMSTEVLVGMKKSATDASTAPVRKYGRRRPRRVQVRSLRAPITGWTSRPVSGAASQSPGMSSLLAPSRS